MNYVLHLTRLMFNHEAHSFERFGLSICDPLGIAGPLTLCGKIIFRELCDEKAPWDQPLSPEIEAKWLEWKEALPKELSVPRAFKISHNEVKGIWLYTFADTSLQIQSLCSKLCGRDSIK